MEREKKGPSTLYVYDERVGQIFAGYVITEGEKKRSVILSLIGPSIYNLIRELIAPTKPGDASFENLLKT